VRGLRATETSSGVDLQWRATSDDTTAYAIYRRDRADEDRCPDNDARNLLATVRSTDGLQTYVDTTADKDTRYTYFVSALDRTWNESVRIPVVS
jgi:hypothetical protein